MAHQKARSCFIDSAKSSKFSWTLHKEDGVILLKLILDVSRYSEDVSNIINTNDSESYRDLMFFLLTIILQQKRINRSNTSDKKKDVTLLDFMSK